MKTISIVLAITFSAIINAVPFGEEALKKLVSIVMESSSNDQANVCWRDIFAIAADKFSCPDNGEVSLGKCYQPCKTGYLGIGPYCFSTNLAHHKNLISQSADLPLGTPGTAGPIYHRLQISSSQAATSNLCGHGKTFSFGKCMDDEPLCGGSSTYPYPCGLVCTSSKDKCKSVLGDLSFTVVKIFESLNDFDIDTAWNLAMQLFDELKTWPDCKDVAVNNGRRHEIVEKLAELLNQFK